MLLFLKNLADAFRCIPKLTWTHHETGLTVRSRLFAVCCTVDTPARAKVLSSKQFNGYNGCSWCYQIGTAVDKVVKYPFLDGVPERTHGNITRDMKAALREGRVVNGVTGLSPLALLRGIDLVWGVIPDYMHCVLEGVQVSLLTCGSQTRTAVPTSVE